MQHKESYYDTYQNIRRIEKQLAHDKGNKEHESSRLKK